MFKRIFAYDNHLRDSENIVVLVVAQTIDGSDVTAVTAAFRATGMYPAAITIDSFTADLTADAQSALDSRVCDARCRL